MATSFTVSQSDLEFILRQIRIAEAQAGGLSMTQAIQNEFGVSASDANLMPAGLRTVDGSFNNLTLGSQNFGAADQLFPRMTDPAFLNDADGDTMNFGPGGVITNNNYGVAGSVADADPRIISNLIVDQSVNNPAAIAVWLANPLSQEAWHAVHGENAIPVAPSPGYVLGPNEVFITNQDIADIPNLSPDIGLSPGFNSWMTFFGQFFDHGLDLVTKGGNGTIYIPLQPDDPLYVVGSHTNFMVVTRATKFVDPVTGLATETQNTTTPFVDQNQTYTSHPSHQVFLREYQFSVDSGGAVGNDSFAVSTGRLIDGMNPDGSSNGAPATWGETKAAAALYLGIQLVDTDVFDVPVLKTDAYGNFIPGANGFAQILTNTGTEVDPVYVWVEGVAGGLLLPANTVRTGHAFLNDIAHNAAPGSKFDHDGNPATPTVVVQADTDTEAGNAIATDSRGNKVAYDDELLNAHFITGDGRGNENIALTTVHAVFHSEHNRLVEENKKTILESGNLAFLNEWLVVDVAALPAPADVASLIWDGERLFAAAKFVTEMQYQHLVFEEFARRIQPAVDPFVFTHSPDVDASIVAEFAHTVYRFGHSMLTDTVQRLDNDLTPLGADTDQITLIEAFLNPLEFMANPGIGIKEAIGAIVRGTVADVGNAMDEFIVPAVRSNLLGLPLDLAAINIARGRDTGIPSLNEVRKQFYNDYGLPDLKPYTSWIDFAQHIKHPVSIINFIAAYGTHELITGEATLEGKRGAAMAIVLGTDQELSDGRIIVAPADRLDFLNARGVHATPALGGMNNIDFWIGGLAEELNEFGGMLGSTFNLVFEFQMEQLQSGDRFYYLSRTQGTNLLNQLEPNTFADLVMRNSTLGDEYSTHINGAVFVTPDHIFELDRGIAQAGADPTHDDPFLQAIDPKLVRDYTGAATTVVGGVTHDVGGYMKFSGGEHVVMGGTEGNDTLISDKGIDTHWGDGGNDYINAGMEADNVFGGEGDDVIEDPWGDDVLRGGAGNDVISAGAGLDLIFGDEGNDFIIVGQDDKDSAGDAGDDFMLGGTGNDFMLGGSGNDWMEGGQGFDVLAGENSELFFNSPIIGHDVLWGQGNDQDYDAESGDDIMLSGPGIQRFEGMFGFDWGIAKFDPNGVKFDFQIPIFTTIATDILKDRFDQVEGGSGWIHDDVLQGDDRGHNIGGSSAPDSVPAELFADHVLTAEGMARISGLTEFLDGDGNLADGLDGLATLFGVGTTTYQNGNILMGGGGGDVLRGRGGYDILDGDAWLNVRISINMGGGVFYTSESMTTDVTQAGPNAGRVLDQDGNVMFGGRSLQSLMLDRTLNPGQLEIVREIRTAVAGDDIDTAVFQGTLAEYDIEGRVLDVNGNVITAAADENGDGFIQVSDRDTGTVGVEVNGVRLNSRGPLTDDTDLVRNVEQFQFADQTIVIGGTNQLATGVVTIVDDSPLDGVVTPYVGQVLTATLTNVVDGNGIDVDANGTPTEAYTFEWQTTTRGANTGWTTIQTSLTYTVRSVDPGQILRAVAVFEDALGTVERIASAPTASPTAAYNVAENSVAGTVVAAGIPFNVDTDAQSFNGQPPADVNPRNLYHEIDSANTAGGRFTVVPNGVDVNGFPLYAIVVNEGGAGALNFEAGVHTAGNQSYQFIDNQYQIVVNSYSDTPENGGVLVAVRQFTILLNNVEPEIAAIAPIMDLQGTGVLSNFTEDFASNSYTLDDGAWTEDWVEAGDNNSSTSGEIAIIGGRLRFNGAIDGGETLTRAVNLTGATSATLTFSYVDDDTSLGENIVVEAWNGESWVQLGTTLAGSFTANGAGTFTAALTAPMIGDHSQIRFRAEGDWETTGGTTVLGVTNGDNFYIDNINIAVTTPTADVPYNHETTFTEDGPAVSISANPVVADADSTKLLAATITITNAEAGDVLTAGTLPVGLTATIDTSVPGKVTMYLSGIASLNAYQVAIGTVRFANTSQNPVPGDRLIDVSVHDGQLDSNIAVAIVTVVAVDDPFIAGADLIVTNIANADFVVPEWALLANDGDPDTAGIIGDITAVGAPLGLINLSLATNPGAVTLQDTDPGGGSFNYQANGAIGNATVVRDLVDIIGNNTREIIVADGLAHTINGNGGNDIIFSGGGNDTVLGGAGADTITWNVGDARDQADGGTESDTFALNGDASAETFRIYTRAEALLAGMVIANALTEIVITRNGTATANIIAELDNIEEITVNTQAVVSGGWISAGDTIEVIGDFTQTSLNLNTITIDGNAGNDTVDITALSSAHRIVFRSNGGNDTIVGTLRPQDVIELPGGATAADYVTSTNVHGVTTMVSDEQTITFTATAGMPQFTNTVTETGTSNIVNGTAAGETLLGIEGRDIVFAGAGNDNVLANAGSDLAFGDAGDDRIFGEAGNDIITAGAGTDTVIGGAGDDRFIGEIGDGNDSYYGDDMDGGVGSDTLDLSAINANITADLGGGMMNRGSATSTESGTDTFWGVENIITGNGADVITANAVVNVIDGGNGRDIFRFNTAADANGDTIASFQPGDRIDLTGIDANGALAGDQAFRLVTGAFTNAAQLVITQETHDGQVYTVVSGNAGGTLDADFKINIKGTHILTATDFTL